MNTVNKVVIAAIFCGSLASGCQHRIVKKIPEGHDLPTYVDAEETNPTWNNVSLIDHDLGGSIATQRTGWNKTRMGTLEAWAQFRNRTDFPYQLEARVTFYDMNKRPLSVPSAWQRLYLPANAHDTVVITSHETQASYYNIELRTGR